MIVGDLGLGLIGDLAGKGRGSRAKLSGVRWCSKAFGGNENGGCCRYLRSRRTDDALGALDRAEARGPGGGRVAASDASDGSDAGRRSGEQGLTKTIHDVVIRNGRRKVAKGGFERGFHARSWIVQRAVGVAWRCMAWRSRASEMVII